MSKNMYYSLMFDGNNVWLYPKQLQLQSFLMLYFAIRISVLHHCFLLENRFLHNRLYSFIHSVLDLRIQKYSPFWNIGLVCVCADKCVYACLCLCVHIYFVYVCICGFVHNVSINDAYYEEIILNNCT